MIVKNDLFDYQNRYIFQDTNSFKFSVDSILLSEFANRNLSNKKILDMCSGNGPIPLILSKYTDSHITAFEIQKNIYDLGIKSVEINNLSNQITFINDDIKNINNYFNKNYFDIILCNPPYFRVTNEKVINQNINKQIARHEIKITLEDIFKIANSYLNSKGIFYLVHQIERLDEIIYLGYKYNINIKELQMISTKEISSPKIILVKAVKGSKEGIKVNKIISIDNLKTYQNMFKNKE